jgi:hypothetical protein
MLLNLFWYHVSGASQPSLRRKKQKLGREGLES